MQVGWTPSPSRVVPVRVRALYLPRSAAGTPLWTSWEKSLTCTSQMTSSGPRAGGASSAQPSGSVRRRSMTMLRPPSSPQARAQGSAVRRMTPSLSVTEKS